MASWDIVRNHVTSTYSVNDDYGDAISILIDNVVARSSALVSVGELMGTTYVSVDVAIGGIAQSDLVSAVKGAGQTLGGVTTIDDLVTLRESFCLCCLDVKHLDLRVSYLGGVAVAVQHML